MSFRRTPTCDPRTVARDIPGVLDVLFPRLRGALVNALNTQMFSFPGIDPVSTIEVGKSRLQSAMIFEIAMARVESQLRGDKAVSWEDCLMIAARKQRRYFDARIPEELEQGDIILADHAARNLVAMLNSVRAQRSSVALEQGPLIPGLGWVASGNGDFAIGSMLIEVKHTERNFGAGDFRQVLMYWLLRYARSIETNYDVWSEVLLLNPRRNAALLINYDYLLQTASASSNRVELLELLRSAVGKELDRR